MNNTYVLLLEGSSPPTSLGSVILLYSVFQRPQSRIIQSEQSWSDYLAFPVLLSSMSNHNTDFHGERQRRSKVERGARSLTNGDVALGAKGPQRLVKSPPNCRHLRYHIRLLFVPRIFRRSMCMACSNASAVGGHPGTYTSTGTTRSHPLTTLYE